MNTIIPRIHREKYVEGTKRINLVGMKFGKLLVISYVENQLTGRACWLVQCECGNRKIICNVKGRKSCGCSNIRFGSHGEAAANAVTTEYRAWANMVQRCHNPSHRDFHNYGGRGILVCKRWLEDYTNFIADMGRKPTPKHSLERINNALGYSKKNCQWALMREQIRNRRTTRTIVFEGRRMAIAAALESVGMEASKQNILRVCWRLENGWRPFDAIMLPAQQKYFRYPNAEKTESQRQ